MKKTSTNSLASPLVIALGLALVATTVLGFVLVPAGTDLPIHWGISGEADRFAPREVALLLPLGITVLVWGIVFAVRGVADAADFAAGRYPTRTALAALTGIMLALSAATILIGTGVNVGMVQVVTLGLAALAMMLGNALPKSQPNSIAGIRVPTTLRDARNWQLTHRLVGLLYLVAGPLLALLVLIGQPAPVLIVGLLVAMLGPLIVGTIYSLLLARRSS